MGYRVVLAERAWGDAEEIYLWVTEQSPADGAAWFERMIEALESLSEMPHRCPAASIPRYRGRVIRCLPFGNHPGIYRILFEVNEREQIVSVLHIVHGARLSGI